MFEQAHEEFKITRRVSTGNGELYCGQTRLSMQSSVPVWFVRDELGYDGPVGTRLYTMVPQERIERRHQASQVDAPPVPAPQAMPRKGKQRETAQQRRARLEALETRAMVKMLMNRRAA